MNVYLPHHSVSYLSFITYISSSNHLQKGEKLGAEKLIEKVLINLLLCNTSHLDASAKLSMHPLTLQATVHSLCAMVKVVN